MQAEKERKSFFPLFSSAILLFPFKKKLVIFIFLGNIRHFKDLMVSIVSTCHCLTITHVTVTVYLALICPYLSWSELGGNDSTFNCSSQKEQIVSGGKTPSSFFMGNLFSYGAGLNR